MDPGNVQAVALAAETQYVANGITSRTLLKTETLRVVLFGFAEGQELTEHSTPRSATVQVLSGECDFTLNDTAHHLQAGDLLYLPPGARHAVKAPRRFSMLLTLAQPATAGNP
jgi:quercetin dioxygenase-like cupin family protein